jgi:hypothetical protein
VVYVDRRTYHAIKNTLTPAEKELISYYDMQWFLVHRVPTVEQVTEHLRNKFPKLRHTSVNYYLNRAPVQKALKDRGIPFEQHTQEQLTPTQVAVAVTMMNFADTRTNADKLDSLGVNSSQYYAWLNDPAFKNMIENLADQNLANIRPTAIGEFTKKINEGDWQAVKYYLDVTGAAAPESEGPTSKVLLQMIIEIIQKHVKDPATIAAIAQDMLNVTNNRSLKVIDSTAATEPVQGQEPLLYSEEPDHELEHAKKMLGF